VSFNGGEAAFIRVDKKEEIKHGEKKVVSDLVKFIKREAF
jgi:hypothetical protein